MATKKGIKINCYKEAHEIIQNEMKAILSSKKMEVKMKNKILKILEKHYTIKTMEHKEKKKEIEYEPSIIFRGIKWDKKSSRL